MKAIEIYNDGNVLNYKYYDLVNGNKKVLRSTAPTYVVLEKIENGEIYRITPVGSDVQFNSNNTRITIRNYNQVKNLKDISDLINKINLAYRKEKLRRQKVRRQNLLKKAFLIAGVPAILYVGIKTFDAVNKNNIIIPTSDIKIEGETNNETPKNQTIIIDDEELVMEEENIIEDTTPKVNIDFDNRTDSSKYIKAKELYSDLITKYAKRYGIDPNLMLAVATQERGIHSEVIDSDGGYGLMQIQYSQWINKNIQVFNYETNSYETLNITTDMIKNLETNIKLGCMIMQDNLNRLNNNPLLSLQAYNYGFPCASACISAYAKDNNLSYKEAILDYTNTGWMNYRKNIGGGDPVYVEHVLSYIGDDFKITNMSRDGVIALRVSNEAEARTYS